MLGEKTYCGVASHPGGSSDTLSFFMLKGTGTGFCWVSHWAQVQTVYLFSKDCVIIIVTNIYKQLVKSTIMMIK